MPEEEMLRVGGVEGERMDVSRSERRPGGAPADGRPTTRVQDDGQRDNCNGSDCRTAQDEGTPRTAWRWQ